MPREDFWEMNRSFRAQETVMRPSVKQRRSVIKEKDEDLALFLEMQKLEERNDLLLLHDSEEFDSPLGSKKDSSTIFNVTSATPARKTGADDFLNTDNDKNDYDWLLTPPGTPPFPLLEMESRKTLVSQTGTPRTHPSTLKSKLANPQPGPAIRHSSASRQAASTARVNSTGSGILRPSSSGGPGSRSATSTGHPTSRMSSKSMFMETSKSTWTTELLSTTVSKPSRSATPTSRTNLPSSKATVPPRSSTPTARSSARSSTPTSRPSVPASTLTTRPSLPISRASSRAPTPTRRPSTLSCLTNASAVPVKNSSSSVTRSVPTTAKNPAPPRASSPTVKPRLWNPSEMPGYTLDAPPNLRTSLPERSVSATRGRPGVPAVRSSSIDPGSCRRVRRQSCSPARGRPPNGITSGSSVPAINRAYAKANVNVSPVAIGTKMVERVINMRKLVPPKQDDKHSPHSNISGKSSSPVSLGFGRTLSKKSLDMAMRHMDIRPSVPGSLRPMMRNIPASSMYSVRSGPNKCRTVSVSGSSLATSSNASSEVSANNNALCVDGSEVDDDISSDKGIQSSSGVQGR